MSDRQIEVKRVYDNILVLLKQGAFPGEWAAILAEAQQFVTEMLTNIEIRIKNEQAAKDGTSTGPAADASGMVGSDVSDSGRESTVGDSNGTGQPESGTGTSAA